MEKERGVGNEITVQRKYYSTQIQSIGHTLLMYMYVYNESSDSSHLLKYFCPCYLSTIVLVYISRLQPIT